MMVDSVGNSGLLREAFTFPFCPFSVGIRDAE